GDPKLFAEAVRIAHILKYSHERLPNLSAQQRGRGRLLLEVETFGGAGLRYRSKLLKKIDWHRLGAVPAPVIVDTAGAGDWCTAGLLAVLARNGVAGAERATESDVATAMRFGQVAAAVACGYEGARGAMNVLDRESFQRVSTACDG